MADELLNVQSAPYPDALADLVTQLRYRPDWTFALEDIVRDPARSHGAEARGLTFIVTTMGHDAYHPERGQHYGVHHYFPVPPATFNRRSWTRWLFDCLVRVETHEAMEFFALEAPHTHVLQRPYAPTHGPGDDPYVVHEYATEEQARTRFTGEVLI